MFGDNAMRSLAALTAVLIALSASHQASAAYDFTGVADPNGLQGTSANGIDNAGVIVGSYTDSSGTHGFVDAANVFTNFDAGNETYTVAGGISSNGTVAGYATNSSGATDGFTGSGLVYTSFDVPGGVGQTFATGISPSGSATIGYYVDANSVSHGFLYGGSFTPIDAPNATSTVATGVNAAGTTVGYYTDATGTHGFMRSAAGVYTAINDPDGTYGTYVTGINDLGEISGYYIDAAGNVDGFVSAGADFVTVDAPGSAGFTEINGINDSGTIVGVSIDPVTGYSAGFVATVPEPATLSILGSGVLAVLTARRRRAR
jgi:hypothetical protein